ncbi:replication-associated protein [Crucivirus-88]|nr:replication-associated protein [Crucivirus-88]
MTDEIVVSVIGRPEKHTGGGNTNTPPLYSDSEYSVLETQDLKTQKHTKNRKWIFTINNYSDEEVKNLKNIFEKNNRKYIMGYEVAPTTGTPHIQGYMESKNAVTFTTMKGYNGRMKLIMAKGSIIQNYNYCSKEGNFITNITDEDLMPKGRKSKKKKENELWLEQYKNDILDEEYGEDIKWKDWQKEIINILDSKPDKRSIYWYYSEDGNKGKSYLCKYLTLTRKVIICSGKQADIFNQVKLCLDEMIAPEIILLDIPRTNNEYVNYSAIESLKNGCLYSGKYEGGQVLIKTPHIIAFSNELPNIKAMSSDRWKIKEIL